MRVAFIFLMVLSLSFMSRVVEACEYCTIMNLGKKDRSVSNQKETKFEVEIFYEAQDWREIPAEEAHELHENGHHLHDKQNEEIIHAMLKAQLNERFSFELDLPYVTRHSIEVESHARLGNNEVSRGLGDLTITTDYRFIKNEEKSVGLIAGIKVPTGDTNEFNSGGDRFEPELQPGTGSVDYLTGLSGSLHRGVLDLSGNAIYVYKTEGAQDFRFGDVFSVTLYAGRNSEINNNLRVRTGVMINNQIEKKQNNRGGGIKDSGGYSMLIGPQIGFDAEQVSLDFSYLAPAVQELGGVHQELNGIWTASAAVKF